VPTSISVMFLVPEIPVTLLPDQIFLRVAAELLE